jgi:hypothetical protein
LFLRLVDFLNTHESSLNLLLQAILVT